jgi:hypothetical protein
LVRPLLQCSLVEKQDGRLLEWGDWAIRFDYGEEHRLNIALRNSDIGADSLLIGRECVSSTSAVWFFDLTESELFSI